MSEWQTADTKMAWLVKAGEQCSDLVEIKIAGPFSSLGPREERAGSPNRRALVNDYAAVNLNDRAPNDDPTMLVLVIVVRPPLIDVGPAAVLLGLTWR